MEKEQLKAELKQHIVTYLNLLETKPEDIADDMSLFGDGLGLDSIDSLELIVLLEREYKVKIKDPKDGRKVLVNVNSMVDFILENQK